MNAQLVTGNDKLYVLEIVDKRRARDGTAHDHRVLDVLGMQHARIAVQVNKGVLNVENSNVLAVYFVF